MFKNLFYVPVLAALILTSPTFAQDIKEMSADEIASAFAKQKTRGLVLAPVNPSKVKGEEDSIDANYVQLAADEQVSIEISFDFDSSILRDDQKPRMSALCEVMKKAESSSFKVVGHTDSSGSAGYNARLSLLRAQEVKRFLVNDCGVADYRLEAIGVGETFLIDQENPEAESNRRVEFQILG
jgi:outer membrane protein OmpA-like peptidoglycan-associated protein